jgi:hypothetical protein
MVLGKYAIGSIKIVVGDHKIVEDTVETPPRVARRLPMPSTGISEYPRRTTRSDPEGVSRMSGWWASATARDLEKHVTG